MDKYQNKYRIPSARLQNWDYGSVGAYFVTICLKNKKCLFGEINQTSTNSMMQLSEIGKIVESEWIRTLELRPDMNLQLGCFVVMPNHFHAIIIIGENKYNVPSGNCRDAMPRVSSNEPINELTEGVMDIQQRDAKHRVSTDESINEFMEGLKEQMNEFGVQYKNLASILRGFKSTVTLQARNIKSDFAWQPRFYDHIIRNQESFEQIQNYIVNNPQNWSTDEFY